MSQSQPPQLNDLDARPLNQWTWFRHLNGYHWFVLLVAALGWLFDTMDQQIFALARKPAMKELLTEVKVADDGTVTKTPPEKEDVDFGATMSTSVFLIGWAAGGLFFGVLGDRVGRAKVMLWTILIYSACTGLSAFSTGFWDFCFYRFLTGLGVGGEFAVGVSLVAEVMPARIRTYALGLLQASSTVGNATAAGLNMYLGHLDSLGELRDWNLMGMPMTAWRVMFIIGAVPALVAILVRWKLKEPESWVAAKLAAKASGTAHLGSYTELFRDPLWRRNALVGLTLGASGIVGLWGIGFFIYELFSGVVGAHLNAIGTPPEQIQGQVAYWTGVASLLMNFGGFFGMYLSSFFSNWIGRRPAFAIAFLAAMASTAFTFSQLDQFSEMYWMVPIMGFCQFSLFGLYAIYFPELFPTRLRSTGTSFCYNVGRIVAAAGPAVLGLMTKYLYTKENGFEQGFRWAAVTMCGVFVIGLLALPFAPETKGKPLPE
ncbi:MAG: MFS transporter [Pirellulaceae bacterium]